MQTLTELNEHFAIPGLLRFEEGQGGLPCAQIATPACAATLYLHGAHLTHWQPAGQAPVLFLSERSLFESSKAIRGGVPLIFPWFGNREGAPTHGFARTSTWQVAFAAVSGDDLHLILTLGPDETTRALGYDRFRVAYEIIAGRTLTLRMSVANQAETPLSFEQALHTYLSVGNAEAIQVLGLEGTEFLDKTDDFQRKRQHEAVLQLTGVTDRPYLNTEATVTVADPTLNRRIVVAKQGSRTTVVWNPWSELAATLPDLGPEEWRNMVCIETANAADNTVTLQPQQAHAMEAKFSIEPLTPKLEPTA